MTDRLSRVIRARSRERRRHRAPAGIGVRFRTDELVRHAGPTQMVLSTHDDLPRRRRSTTIDRG